jgi:hypothetical protein
MQLRRWRHLDPGLSEPADRDVVPRNVLFDVLTLCRDLKPQVLNFCEPFVSDTRQFPQLTAQCVGTLKVGILALPMTLVVVGPTLTV